MAKPESANVALDAFIARFGLRRGAAILGISHPRLAYMRREPQKVPLELVPAIVLGADNPEITFASVRPDFFGFHLAAALHRRTHTGRRHLGDLDTPVLTAMDFWLRVASGQPVAWPERVKDDV